MLLPDKALAPQGKREAIGKMIEQFQFSERRACQLVGLSRESLRNPPKASEQTQALRCRIVNIAYQRRRYGYRWVHDLLRRFNRGAQAYSPADGASSGRKNANRVDRNDACTKIIVCRLGVSSAYP